ncbi:MAG: helix-turn-helix transcriptional regulator [Rudaea sp.]|uniref:helix-turn-helix domain-containing protein n=1 Tax=unclassified Rudaea TaxID=2627037 RepID=UPI0010F515BE|nr:MULTISPECIES: AraC family transcriptional regulator [unclassified Rudaea]MBN8884951.1 helix-turn-helix transcriptional regulator [Rudaea sp.]
MTPSCSAETSLSRSVDELLQQLDASNATPGQSVRMADGWRMPICGGLGFRYEYDSSVANGGWEFYRLHNGICIALVRMTTQRRIVRRHNTAGYLALSAVLDGNVLLTDDLSVEGELADGYCTIYGSDPGRHLETVYEPGAQLRWVTLYFERSLFFSLTGLAEADVPAELAEYIHGGSAYACHNVPLSELASLTAHQLISPPFAGPFLRFFMSAKALELGCYILSGLSQPDSELFGGRFEAEDHRKMKQAMAMIRDNIDGQISVHELAETVGMSRHRLQLGFRMIYGDTVGRIRDKLRMELALDLIRDSNLSMIEIALETGYEHAASFTRAFKSAFGISPIQMRKVANDELRVRNLPGRARPKPAQDAGDADAE